jgi:hypothetical protein
VNITYTPSRRARVALALLGVSAPALGLAAQASAVTAAGTTGVSAVVSETLALTAPADFGFGPLPPGASATSPGKAVNVVSNNAGGYTLTVSSASVVGFDLLPLSMSAAIPTGSTNTAVSGTFGSSTGLGASAQFGARSTGITPAAGEDWTVVFTAGPIPFAASGTELKALVTFTATTI